MARMRSKFSRSKKYREAFVEAFLKRSIPYQITALRKKADLSQEQLAAACGLTQGVISRAENPNYGNLTFNTVVRIAAGLDVAFIGEFVSFRELEERVDHLAERTASISNFKEEKAEEIPSKSVPVISSSYGSGKSAAAFADWFEKYKEAVLARVHHSEELRQQVFGLHDVIAGHGVAFGCASLGEIGEQVNPLTGTVQVLGEQVLQGESIGKGVEQTRAFLRQLEARSLRAMGTHRPSPEQ